MVRASLTSVARAAGVSPSTVSNAYNRPEHLSVAVRERVLNIAAAQGYAGPDPAGRSLRSRRADTIGVLSTLGLAAVYQDPYCRELLTGIAEVAEATGTSMLVMPVAAHDPAGALSHAQVAESVRGVRRALIDGAIADGVEDDHPALSMITWRGLPVVRSCESAQERCVVIDDRGAGREIGRHLRALGHRRVAVVADTSVLAPAGAVGGALYVYGRLRLAGLREGLGEQGEVTVVAAGLNVAACGQQVARELLSTPDPPSAIVAISDALAFGVLSAVAERGLRPGREVSVTGFDDVPEAAPAGLTTVSQPIRAKGAAMAAMLLDPSATARRVELATHLVVRASTGPAPGQHTRPAHPSSTFDLMEAHEGERP